MLILIETILNNKEWIFSGIGVVLFVGIGNLLLTLIKKGNSKNIINQSQTTGDNSQAIQIGNINNGNK